MKNAEAAISSQKGSKKFEYWGRGGGGIKKIRTGGWWVTNLGELLLLGGQYPITSHVN